MKHPVERRLGRKLSLLVVIGALAFVAIPLSAQAANPTRPGPPTNVVAVAVNTAIYTTWTAPTNNGGSPILYYVVSNVYNGTQNCVTAFPNTSCLSTNLTNGQSYTERVRAVNAIGESTTVILNPVTPNTTPNCNYIGPYANLQGCWLVGKDLTGQDLTGANMSGANLSFATLTGANLTGATLTGPGITSITSGGIIGTPAALPPGWGVVHGYLIGPGNGVTNVSFAGVTFGAVDLSNAQMYGDNLTGANLAAVTSFSGTNLSFDNFSNENMNGVNLSGATLSGITSGGITGTPAALPPGWGVVGGYLIGPGNGVTNVSTAFIGVTFGAVNLSGAQMYGDNLTGANLSAVTSFSGTNLSFDNFSNENMTGVNLSGAILSGIQSGGITGTPTALPTGWGVEGGYLIGPGNGVTGVSFAGVTFGPVNLAGAAMYGNNYTNANLSAITNDSGIVLDFSTWSNTTCPDGTNSDNDGGTCVNNL